ncbi:MAG: hypothetical protein CMB57_04020 [Euryarchaeota archaeon]|nr:hypothetical protein [Euryarchaeota archaeon]|tara:strand:- start:109 stop:696 length:588 start_codon:yes stop_codon:yes gene_type:complete
MIAVTTTNFVELYSALPAEQQEYFVKTLNDSPFFSGFFGANAMVGTQAKQPVPVAVETPTKAKSPQSKGKENVCPPSPADSCAELDTPSREDVNDEPSSEKQDPAMDKPYITAEYNIYIPFKVPDYLLKPEENNKVGFDVVGSWYIKWNTLHYINKDGEEVEVEALTETELAHDYKRPDAVHYGDDNGYSAHDSD